VVEKNCLLHGKQEVKRERESKWKMQDPNMPFSGMLQIAYFLQLNPTPKVATTSL
jgi:hypothetical protein